jgi:hypothetical protein
VGENYGSIVNCYATGNVEGSNVGGLVGNNLFGSITNCYAAGNVEGSGGGLVGWDNTATANIGGITNCYFDSQTSGQNDVGKGTGLTTSEMKSQWLVDKLNMGAAANNADNNLRGWVYRAGDYPTFSNARPLVTISDYLPNGDGTQNNPYIIQTPEQLEYFSVFVNTGKTFSGEYIKLGANIMLNDTTDWRNWATTAPARTWTPIGTSSEYFRGTFDGAGYVVGGVYINNTSDAQGLFGCVDSGGVIRNLGVAASYVKGGNSVGGLTGSNNGSIANCYVAGNVSGIGGSVGGLVGNNGGIGSYSCSIANCYAAGTVSGSNYIGGLAGINGGSIINCYATGTVSGSNYVGGLVGENYYGYIFYCYYDSQTSGQSDEGKGIPKTTTEMKQQTTYNGGWDFVDIWGIDAAINNGYPYLLIRSGSTPIHETVKSRKFGVLLEKSLVSQEARISVITPEQSQINLVIYDNLGNAVFEKSGVRNNTDIVWDLTNKAGRKVADGSYLIIAEARVANGKIYRYSTKVGVKR